MTDTTAVILAGGRGERLEPVSRTVPKPLVPLRGRPILDHLTHYLAAGGVTRFVLCTGYLARQVEDFARILGKEFDVACSNAGENATMCERLRVAAPQVTGRALICYGDTLANVHLDRLLAQHIAGGRAATVTVHPLRSPFGLVEFDAAGRVTALEEKPILPHWINIGFVLCEPGLLGEAPPAVDLASWLGSLADGGRLGVYRHTGRHLTVNTERERVDAEHDLATFFTLADQDY